MKFALPKRLYTHRAEYEHVLGTALNLRIRARSQDEAEAAEQIMFSELDRLSACLNRFDPSSELNHWQFGNRAMRLSYELREVLRLVRYWQVQTDGAFHPGADNLAELWKTVASTGNIPSRALIQAELTKLAAPYVVTDNEGKTEPPPFPLNLNGLAKGYIVQHVTQVVAKQSGVLEVLLDIGGDICHMGQGICHVGVVHPAKDAINAPPVCTVYLSGQAIASSGHTQRGEWINDVWHSHLLDPRTGQSVNTSGHGTIGATVIADDGTTADALATALCILPLAEGLNLANKLHVGVLLADLDGGLHCNEQWAFHMRLKRSFHKLTKVHSKHPLIQHWSGQTNQNRPNRSLS